MKDVQLGVRAGFFAALGSAVSIEYDGEVVNVPVLDRVPKGQKFPYIHISQQTTDESPTHSARGCTVVESTLLLNVFTGFMGNAGGKELSDIITAKIMQQALPYDEIKRRFTIGVQVPVEYIDDYSIFDIKVDSTFTGEQLTETETEYIIRRSIRFRIYLQQF